MAVSIIASGTTSDGWLEVNPAGDAAAGTLPLNARQTSARSVQRVRLGRAGQG